MEKILTGARKYRLGFTLAHQNLHQLQDNAKVASAVMTQPCTRIVLGVGDDDAKKLAEGFTSFDAQCLKTLEKFHAIVRVERNDFDFNLALRKPELPESDDGCKARIIAASRARYATPRAEVEAMLLATIRPDAGKTKPPTPPNPDEPPSGGPKTPPKTVFLPSAPAEPVLAATPTAPVLPKVSEPPPIVTPPKAAVIPQVTVPSKSTPSAGSKISEDTDEAPPKPISRENAKPKDLGRGGTQHQAIQKRIKEEAEALGFRSIIEKPVLDGLGSVDLWLERPGQIIACEISITTTIDHEVGNIFKCLKADVPVVAVICVDEERLRKIANAVAGSLGSEIALRVGYFQPDQFVAHLKTIPAVIPKEQSTVRRGYKVKRVLSELSKEQQMEKDTSVIRAIAEAMRRPRPS